MGTRVAVKMLRSEIASLDVQLDVKILRSLEAIARPWPTLRPMKLAPAVFLALLACKETKPTEAPPAPAVDVVGLVTQRTQHVLDQGTVSIVVPTEMKRRTIRDTGVVWYVDGDTSQPRISIESGLRATHTREILTPADRVRNLIRAMEDKTLEAVTKRELPDGALVIFERPDHSHLRVFVDRWREGWSVLCEVMVPPRTGAIPRINAIRSWAEETCTSARIETLKPLDGGSAR